MDVLAVNRLIKYSQRSCDRLEFRDVENSQDVVKLTSRP